MSVLYLFLTQSQFAYVQVGLVLRPFVVGFSFLASSLHSESSL